MNEKEISLVDLMVEILLHWRWMVALMVAGGVLLGGFSFVRSVKDAREASVAEATPEPTVEPTAEPKTLEELEESLTPTQKNAVGYALYYEDLYQRKEKYREQSILMQIDPAKVQRADMTFLVTSDDLERAYNIEKVYEDLANGAELIERLAAKCHVPAALIGEIYSIARSSGGSLKGGDTFRVTLIHYDEKICGELAQLIERYLKQKQSGLAEKLGAHEISVLHQSIGTIGNTGIQSSQDGVRSELMSLRSSIEGTKAAFSEDEKLYYALLTGTELPEKKEEPAPAPAEGTDPAAETEETVPAEPGVSLKYVVLGMVFAAVAYVFVLFLLYVMDSKLRATDRLQELYGIPQLGQIPQREGPKKPLGFVDDWILALRYWNQRKFTPEGALDLAAVAVKMAAGKEGLSAVCLIGCDLKGQVMEDCGRIKGFLESEKMETRILDNILYDVEAMENLESVQGAVLIEKAGSTLYTEIAQELELLKRQGIKVLGGIVVG